MSSGHAEGGPGCAVRCCRAGSYSSQDAHRRYSLQQTWQHRVSVTDNVVQGMNMEVAGTDDAGYMLVHGKCLVEYNTEKLDCVRELDAGASHLNTSSCPAVSARLSLVCICMDRLKTACLQWLITGGRIKNAE